MAYSTDPYDGALVINGWENGIAENPYSGISDARNVLIASVPGEASVGFSMGSISVVVSAGTVTSVSNGTLTYSGATEMPAGETGFAITFGTVSGYSGFSAGTTVYWVKKVANNTFNLYSDFTLGSLVTVTGSGNAGFKVHNVDFNTGGYFGNQPEKFCRSTVTGSVFMLDYSGKVWTNKSTTTSGYWRYVGNVPHSTGGSLVNGFSTLYTLIGDLSNGNGIVFYQSQKTPSTGYVFIFSDSSIDYFQDVSLPAIKYGWNPASAVNNQSANYLHATTTGASHDALVGQDNVVYFCDASYLGSFFEISGQTFNPLSSTTFTVASKGGASDYALQLPAIDSANCLAELGTNLLVGGTRNLIYPWDRISSTFNYPIWLTEFLVQKMMTVQSSTYIFVGNRGRIHITNGSNVQVWYKLPDHLSGTVEPYYQWGGVAASKNQIYFSVKATTNAGVANTNYGGIWALEMSTKALRLVNQLSYGTYAGYAPALFANTPLYTATVQIGNPSGSGLFVGWESGASTYGIDQTTSNPYTGSQSYLDSEIIPIGTFTKPRTFQQIEYLLTKPLVSGESIKLQYRTDFSQSFTTIATDSTVGNYTNTFPTNWNYSQWIQIRAVLSSTTSSPSFVRLKHIRLTGLMGTSSQA